MTDTDPRRRNLGSVAIVPAARSDLVFADSRETGRDAVRRSYVKLEARAEVAARGLTAAGLRPGARVGIPEQNRVEVVKLMLDALRGGFVVVPINLKQRELSSLVEHRRLAKEERILISVPFFHVKTILAIMTAPLSGALLPSSGGRRSDRLEDCPPLVREHAHLACLPCASRLSAT